MASIYVLLVGINEYNDPDSRLHGCVKDVKHVEEFVVETYSKDHDVHVLKLVDEQATYRGIIDAFRSHLGLAGPQDSVWFHYSGHGTEEWTAREFARFDPNGRDQTLLCHDSGRSAENLADKELAALLSELTCTDEAQNITGPHMVVSLDCCHSGSGTRHAGEQNVLGIRSVRPRASRRPLDSYLDGFYLHQSENLQVPLTPHVAISACKTYQTAGDTSSGGVFTSGLLDALESSGGNISYADLFLHTKYASGRRRRNQEPQFAAIHNFDPYSRFLLGGNLGSPQRYEVSKHSRHSWVVKCGAIHGLEAHPQVPVSIEIQSPAPEFKPLGTAEIEHVGAFQSTIDFSRSLGLKTLFGSLLGRVPEYRGVLKSMPQPAAGVYIETSADGHSALSTNLPESRFVSNVKDPRDATISVGTHGNRIKVRDHLLSNGFYIDFESQKKYNSWLGPSLDKVVKWHRFAVLRNPNPHSILNTIGSLGTEIIDKNFNKTFHSGTEVKVYVSSANARTGSAGGELLIGLEPKARILKPSGILYLYLYFLNDDYSIQFFEEPKIYRPFDVEGTEISLWSAIQGFGPTPSVYQTNGFFKLLITTEEFDHYQLLQTGIFPASSPVDQGEYRSGGPAATDDWTAWTMRLTVPRILGNTRDAGGVVLVDGSVKVRSNAVLSADVSVCTSEITTESADPVHEFRGLANKDVQLITMDNEATGSAFEIIELNTGDAFNLANNPLEIEMQDFSMADGLVVAIAFDGKSFVVIGAGDMRDGTCLIRIPWLPGVDIKLDQDGRVISPFTGEPAHVSLFERTKIGLFHVRPDSSEVLAAFIGNCTDPEKILI